MFTNTRLFKVSAEAWTPASSCTRLPAAKVPWEPEQGLEDKTPSGSLVHSWPRGALRPTPILGPRVGVEPQGQRTPSFGGAEPSSLLLAAGVSPGPLPGPAPCPGHPLTLSDTDA